MSLRQVSEGAFFTSLQHHSHTSLQQQHPTPSPTPKKEEKSLRFQCNSSLTGGPSTSCFWCLWVQVPRAQPVVRNGAALQCRTRSPGRAGPCQQHSPGQQLCQSSTPAQKENLEMNMDFPGDRERRIRINRNYYSFMLYPFWYPLPPSISRRKVLRQYNFYIFIMQNLTENRNWF